MMKTGVGKLWKKGEEEVGEGSRGFSESALCLVLGRGWERPGAVKGAGV